MTARQRARLLLAPRYWPSWLAVALWRALALLPLPVLARLGAAVGLLGYRLYASRRHVAEINIRRCFPELPAREQDALVRAHFRALGQSLLDAGIAWWASPQRLKRLVRTRQREHYDHALARGRNIILLAPHFVGLEIGGVFLSSERPIASVFRHPDNPVLARVIERGRRRFGARLVEHNRPFKTLVRELRAGKPLYYLPDQDAGLRHSVFVPFFGIPAATFSALGRLAWLADAVVIPVLTRQLPRGRGYEIVFYPPLADFPSGDETADAARMNAEIERLVRACPAQYFWVHKRFKTRPRGEPDFYKG
jgi:KDO2-lipid IV(A) lauroyltransferase